MATDATTLEINELEKYILLLIYIDDEPIQSRQKLQLVMYMLGDFYHEIQDWCNYTIRDDGPYSAVLDDTLERLIQMKLVQEKDNTIQLTDQSTEYARIVAEEKGDFQKFKMRLIQR